MASQIINGYYVGDTGLSSPSQFENFAIGYLTYNSLPVTDLVMGIYNNGTNNQFIIYKSGGGLTLTTNSLIFIDNKTSNPYYCNSGIQVSSSADCFIPSTTTVDIIPSLLSGYYVPQYNDPGAAYNDFYTPFNNLYAKTFASGDYAFVVYGSSTTGGAEKYILFYNNGTDNYVDLGAVPSSFLNLQDIANINTLNTYIFTISPFNYTYNTESRVYYNGSQVTVSMGSGIISSQIASQITNPTTSSFVLAYETIYRTYSLYQYDGTSWKMFITQPLPNPLKFINNDTQKEYIIPALGLIDSPLYETFLQVYYYNGINSVTYDSGAKTLVTDPVTTFVVPVGGILLISGGVPVQMYRKLDSTPTWEPVYGDTVYFGYIFQDIRGNAYYIYNVSDEENQLISTSDRLAQGLRDQYLKAGMMNQYDSDNLFNQTTRMVLQTINMSGSQYQTLTVQPPPNATLIGQDYEGDNFSTPDNVAFFSNGNWVVNRDAVGKNGNLAMFKYSNQGTTYTIVYYFSQLIGSNDVYGDISFVSQDGSGNSVLLGYNDISGSQDTNGTSMHPLDSTNSVIYTLGQSSNISLDTSTGILTFSQAGKYKFDAYVNYEYENDVNITDTNANPYFALRYTISSTDTDINGIIPAFTFRTGTASTIAVQLRGQVYISGIVSVASAANFSMRLLYYPAKLIQSLYVGIPPDTDSGTPLIPARINITAAN